MANEMFKQGIAEKLIDLILPEPESLSQEPYCRLCLAALGDNKFKQLFTPFNTIKSIVEVVEDFAGVKILEEDEYSKLVCLCCFEILTATEKFKYLIENSDFRLKNQSETTSKNVENNSYDCNTLIKDENEFEKIDIDHPDLISHINIKEEPEESLTETANLEEQVTKVERENEIETSDESELEDKEEIQPQKKKRIRVRKPVLKKCPDCDKIFRSYEGLKAHSYTHTGLYKFYCKFCNRGFSKGTSLRNHERTHLDITAFQCEICGKAFKYTSSLRTHMFSHTETKLFPCSECDKSFRREGELKEHQRRKHSNGDKLLCKLCNRTFVTDMQRRAHFSYAHNPNPAKKATCEICGKSVVSMTVHMKLHTKPYECEICKNAFGSRHTLKNHQLIHSGERLFTCDVCKRGFNQPSSLRSHMRIHSEDNIRYECDLCNKSFKYKQHLGRHQRNVHKKTKEETI